MSGVLNAWRTMTKIPVVGDTVGRRAFALGFVRKAPYFSTVHPRFVEIRPNYTKLVIPNRKSMHNHIGTVHAIALCNGLEAAMGALAEATIPKDRRWIPKGMEVSYTAKASSDITCIAETSPEQWTSGNPDLRVAVKGLRDDGEVVIEGVIKLWVTSKKS